jgi:methionyl-tRNA synthetase
MQDPGAVTGKPEVPFEAFAALDLRSARVTRAEAHPNAEKLLVLTIDLGELGERQIVAGIAKQHRPEDLTGRTIIVVANLKPVRLRGIESRGMLLAMATGDRVVLLTAAEEVPPGLAVS